MTLRDNSFIGAAGRAGRFLIAASAIAFALGFPLAAQEAGNGQAAASDQAPSDASDEDVFGVEESVSSTDSASAAAAQRDAFFTAAGASLVGGFSGSAGLVGTWDDPWGGSFDLMDPSTVKLNPAAGLSLGFTAKPEKNLSFYGEVRTSYPFVSEKTVETKNSAGTVVGTGTVMVPDLSVFKLYSKFDYNDVLFFSFGKQPLAWGQGFFFTPANDIFALSGVDYDDPKAEREGPLSLRVNAPLLGNVLTGYLYAVMQGTSMDPTAVAVAPKIELTLPSIETSLSGYYQKDDKPAVIASASWAGTDMSVFGEGLVSFGSKNWYVLKEDRTVAAAGFLPAMDFHYRIVERANDPLFTGTVGAMYSKSWENKLSLSVVGQYLYDGKAQANLTLDDAAKALAERMDPRYPETADPAVSLSPSGMAALIGRFGTRLAQHYGAVSVNAGSILGSDFSASVFCMANLFDLSGWVKPQLSWQIFDRMTVSAYASFGFGDGGDEYTNMGGIYKALQGISVNPVTRQIEYTEANLTPPMQLGLSFSLGSGSF